MTSPSSSSSSSSPIRPPPCPLSKLKIKIHQQKVFQKFHEAGEQFKIRQREDLFMSELEPREHESELCDGGNGEENNKENKEREDGEGGGYVDREVRRKGVFEISRDFSSAIKRPFRKRKKEEHRDGEIIKSPSARRRGRRIQYGGRSSGGGDGVGGFYICFLRPRTEESPETPTTDPNSETFSFGMLRSLIDKNDFYCKECNPHI